VLREVRGDGAGWSVKQLALVASLNFIMSVANDDYGGRSTTSFFSATTQERCKPGKRRK
jgi:hypothetical protein